MSGEPTSVPEGAGVRGGLAYELPGGARVLFTTRAHGNMSSVSGTDHERGHDTRERLRAQLSLRGLLRGYQVHGTTVLSIRADADIPSFVADVARPPVRADGHVTSVAGVGVMALGADCLPVALGGDGAVAMLHAGWRGLAVGVLEEGVWALRELIGDGEIAAIIGPGAGPCCYEVGREVHAALARSGVHGPGVSGRASSGSCASSERAAAPASSTIDLKAIARARLLAAGVERVDDLGLCTICDARFYSHRREGARAGRQAGIAWLD